MLYNRINHKQKIYIMIVQYIKLNKEIEIVMYGHLN